MIHNIKDTLVKNIIEAFPEAAIRFFIPGAAKLFDFTRPIEFLNGKLHQKDPDTEDRRNTRDARRLDLLLKAFLKNSPLENLKKRRLPLKSEANFLVFIKLYKSFRDITFKHKFDGTIDQIKFKKETMNNFELYAAVVAEEMKGGLRKKPID